MSERRIAVVDTGANGAAIAADMTDAGHYVTGFDQWPATSRRSAQTDLRCDRRAARSRSPGSTSSTSARSPR
jgi:3-hydroxyisobutyrate dehydrogenase-like beta-hydroxyacid dehydrogenase